MKKLNNDELLCLARYMAAKGLSEMDIAEILEGARQ